MGAVTNVAAVVDHLVTLLRDATGLYVEDGPGLGEIDLAAIIVGLPSDGSQPGYTTRATRQQGLGERRYLEACEIRSLLTVSSGNTSVAEVRAAAARHLQAIDVALREQQTVEGVWRRVALSGGMEWLTLQHEQGVTCNVFFTVEAESLL